MPLAIVTLPIDYKGPLTTPMSLSIQWIFIIAGILVCSGLLIFIHRQYRRLTSHRQQEKALQARVDQQRQSTIASIQVLARTMLAGQVELSEGCIRIKVLLDAIAPELHEDHRFAVFNQLYSEIEHMPTHEARKSVDKRFLFKLDKQRWELENKHKVEILAASKKILEHPF